MEAIISSYFFYGQKILICQGWINENGLFVWICSKICKHLRIKFQEQDLRLGIKSGVSVRKWFKMVDSFGLEKSPPMCPAQVPRLLGQLLSLINSSLVHEFWHYRWTGSNQPDYLGGHQDSEGTWNPSRILAHKEKLKKCLAPQLD